MDRRDILAERPLESGRWLHARRERQPVESALHRRVDRQRAGRESRRGRHGAAGTRAFERLQGVAVAGRRAIRQRHQAARLT